MPPVAPGSVDSRDMVVEKGGEEQRSLDWESVAAIVEKIWLTKYSRHETVRGRSDCRRLFIALCLGSSRG